MNQLYSTIGISKQAVCQYAKRQLVFDKKVSTLLIEAETLRNEHPGCGVEKIYSTLNPDFIGRDRFVDLFMVLGFRLNKKRNYKRTTYAGSIYYPNLIKGMQVFAPSTIWQSDITYIYVDGKFYYAVFIIDVYTKKIVGYQVSNHMRATANVKALEMALKDNKAPMIHHSDRGGQYIYKKYLKILNDNNSQISMALSAQDNAYAERINRTIKEEYLDYWKPQNFEQLKRQISKAVKYYNNERPHNNIGKLTPIDFENKWFNNQLEVTSVLTIFDNEKLIKTGQH
jgi:putative transposase